MDWVKNLISYSNSKNVGKCPKCNGENIEVTEHEHGNRKSLTFVCKDCKSSNHFDGLTTK